MNEIKLHTYVALPSRRNTHDKVHSSVALTIFLEVGFKSNLSCCWLDSRVAYFFIFILVAATWRLFPVDDTCSRMRTIYHYAIFFCSMLLTSSITNVQSLSSSSCVRGSLNSVTETVWLSGTAQLMIPFRGSLKHGSQSKGSELTLLLRLVQTTLSLFGFLEILYNYIKFIIL